jgi:S1-C subfamily serine protease
MSTKTVVPLALVCAALGGAGGAVVTSVEGGSTKTTTVVQQAPLANSTKPASDTSALTPRDIYKRDAPGVVFVRAAVTQQSNSPFDLFPQSQQGTATGSGFVLDKDGYILTNAHVVDGATNVRVSFEDKRTVTAKIVGRDTSNDLALLKVDPSGLHLTPLELGSDKGVQVGDPVIAIGNPFGLDRTLTTGVVSALQRKITAPNNFQIANVIQTDAAINPGNSGGPLIDAAGRVIGINSQIETGGSGSNGNIGIGFAVPIDTAKQIVPKLKSQGNVKRAWLGISTLTIDKSLSGVPLQANSGALVQEVTQGGPAEKAGLRAGNFQGQLDGQPIVLGGDIIQAIDGRAVKTADDLGTIVSGKKPGDEITVTVLRDGKKKDVKVTLGDRPNTAAASPQG